MAYFQVSNITSIFVWLCVTTSIMTVFIHLGGEIYITLPMQTPPYLCCIDALPEKDDTK